MGQLIHQNELGAAFEHGDHFQLLEFDAAVAEPFVALLQQAAGLAHPRRRSRERGAGGGLREALQENS